MEGSVTVPGSSYGIILRDEAQSDLEKAAEQIRNLGYAVIDSGYSDKQIADISAAFDDTRDRYIAKYGEARLRHIDEFYTVRSMPTQESATFIRLALNENLISTLKHVLSGKFIINQQNGIVNPPGEKYNQGAWHRDLPYQHFVSSRPLAVNALYCIDNFTLENGATFVLPASHKSERFPSESYVSRNALQVEAKAGCYILIDCMLFHAGGFNSTSLARRAVNHVYNIPFFKQQISLPPNVPVESLTEEERAIFGFNNVEPSTVEEFLSKREAGKIR